MSMSMSQVTILRMLEHITFHATGKTGLKLIWPANSGATQTNIMAYSIFVDANDVYCGGSYDNNALPCYWKNGELHKLPGIAGTTVDSIQVVDGVVYSAGYSSTNACYWINDIEYSLPMPAGFTASAANSIYVVPETLDFYISGHLNSAAYSCYWKNGIECVWLPETAPSSAAFQIYFANGKVYLGGFTASTGYYWVNGKMNFLSIPPGYSSTSVQSMFVYNGDVYTAGMAQSGSYHECYWKNSQLIYVDPATNNYDTWSICVYNNDVYMCGLAYATHTNPFYSVNGTN